MHIVVCFFVCFHPPLCTQLSENDVCDSQIHPSSHLLCSQGSLAQRYCSWEQYLSMEMTDGERMFGWWQCGCIYSGFFLTGRGHQHLEVGLVASSWATRAEQGAMKLWT